MSDRASLRTLLEAELAMLVRRQERLDDHLHNRSREVPQDWSEAATLNSGEEVVEALDERTRHRITELRQTLVHMDDPEWGDCTSCGEAIPSQRLVVLPATRLCVPCAEAHGG